MMNKVYTPDLLMEKYLACHSSKDTVIVDVGCLDGRFVKKLPSRRLYKCRGVEPFLYRPLHEQEALTQKLEREFPFLFMPGKKVPLIPFPDCSVDVVLSNQVVEHVKDRLAHFQEIRMILRPGGIALLLCWYKGKNHRRT